MNSKDRKGYLERVRNRKMAQSPHAYVRGSVIRFYEWLDRNGSALPQGPAIWICGDCHLGNLGALADLEGNVDIQILDFDQTVIGNPAHDLVRLGAYGPRSCFALMATKWIRLLGFGRASLICSPITKPPI